LGNDLELPWNCIAEDGFFDFHVRRERKPLGSTKAPDRDYTRHLLHLILVCHVVLTGLSSYKVPGKTAVSVVVVLLMRVILVLMTREMLTPHGDQIIVGSGTCL